MKNKKLLAYIISSLVTISIVLCAMIINKTFPFGTKGLSVQDGFMQYPGIIMNISSSIRYHTFYSFAGSLGFNVLGSTAYYGLGILNFIYYIFNDPFKYEIISFILLLIRYILLSSSMCFYLNSKKIKWYYVVLLSISYALMGMTTTYYFNYIWTDSIIFLPIIIFYLERLVDNKKIIPFVLFLSLAIIMNFYIGYIIAVFSILYYLYYSIITNKFKSSIKPFIISLVITLLITSFILVPTLFALLNGKAGIVTNGIKFKLLPTYKTFMYLLTPYNYVATDMLYGGLSQIYTGIFALSFAIIYFFERGISKKEKICTLIMFIIFYLSFSVSFLNAIWHMFALPIGYASRFSFAFSFFMIIIAGRAITNIKTVKLNTNLKIIISTVFISLLIICSTNKLWLNIYNGHRNIYLIVFILFSIIYFLLLLFRCDRKNNRWIYIIIIVFFLFDFSSNTLNAFQKGYGEESDYKKTVKLLETKKEILNKIEDNGFYRIYFDNRSTYHDGLLINYNSLRYSNSVSNYNTLSLLRKTLGTRDSFAIGIPEYNYDSLVFDNNDWTIRLLYDVKYHVDKKNNIDKIDYPLSLGYLVNKNILKTQLIKGNNYANINNIYSDMFNENAELYEVINETAFTKTKNKQGNNVSEYKFKADKNSTLVLSFLKYELKINDKTYKSTSKKNNIYRYIINKGDNISIKYIYGKKMPDIVRLALLNMDVEKEYSEKITAHTLNNVEVYKDGYLVQGDVDVENEDDVLFTSIPYENGMRAYVDGKEVKINKALDALISIKLKKGHHKIAIKYFPPGLKLGSAISLIGFLILAIYYKKKETK